MNNLYLRKAESNDMELLYKWANDPVVRQNSFNSDSIPYQIHVSWFHRMMESKTIHQYILMQGDEPIGQIRLTVENNEAEIGYSIASDYRGKGYGHKILQLIDEEMKEHHPEIKRLIAKVKPENEASNRLFVGEGYKQDYIKYTKSLI